MNNSWNLTWAVIWGIIAVLALAGMLWNIFQVFTFMIAIGFVIMFVCEYRRGKGDGEN